MTRIFMFDFYASCISTHLRGSACERRRVHGSRGQHKSTKNAWDRLVSLGASGAFGDPGLFWTLLATPGRAWTFLDAEGLRNPPGPSDRLGDLRNPKNLQFDSLRRMSNHERSF